MQLSVLAAFSTLLSTTTLVAAHGSVDNIIIDGQYISGYLPYQDPHRNPVPERVMRKIPGNGPITDVTSIDIQCNQGSEPAALVASVAAGDNVGLHWTKWSQSHKGPVMTYLAAAPSDITKWEPGNDAVWFKIDESGYDNGKWAATDVLTAQNLTWTVKIPENLKAGQYLMRHEILALHLGKTYPGPQFYPNCIQLEVTGSGNALPTQGLVSFPGAYAPEAVTFNIFAPFTTYPIPGPAVWDGVSDAIGGSTPGTTASAPASTAVGSPTPSPTASPTSTETSSSASTSSPAQTSVGTCPPRGRHYRLRRSGISGRHF